MSKAETRFDIDLQFGQEGEKWLTLLADERKIEVKRDKLWHQTGNIFVEYRFKGNPSGISITESDYIAYILSKNGKQVAVYLWEVQGLRHALKTMAASGRVRIIRGGDNGNSDGFLVPVAALGELTMLCGGYHEQ